MIRAGGGFVARCDPAWMIAQVQLLRGDTAAETTSTANIQAANTPDADAAAAIIQAASAELLALADQSHPRLLARGGGARELEVRVLAPDMIVVHAIVDCQDAMGDNLLNTIAAALAPRHPKYKGCDRRAGPPHVARLSGLRTQRDSHLELQAEKAPHATIRWLRDVPASAPQRCPDRWSRGLVLDRS